MKIEHPNINVSFTVEDCTFHTLSISQYLFKDSLPDHSHSANSYEIHYIISGFGKVKVNNTYYDLKPNTFYVNGPHVVHAHTPFRENPMCEHVIHLQMEPQKEKVTEDSSNSIIHHFQEHSFWIGEDTQNMQGIMQQIFYELDHQYLGHIEGLKALLSLLILASVRNLKEIRMEHSHLTYAPAIDRKSLLIDDYFLYEYKTLALDELAQRLNLSQRQTERYLKEHYNKTFIQKKTESKMSTAALLLSDPKNNITYISEELGYSSIEHFSTAFKRYYGCSPTVYRKNFKL